MHNDFKSLSEIINKEKAFSKIRTITRENDILADFVKIFPELSEVAKPVKIVKSIIYLRVENSVWRSELNFNQKIMIEKINNHYKEEIIKNIKFIS